KAVCFEGNNYSAEWQAEAKKRGLPNVKTTPEALEGFHDKESVALFERLGVLSKTESHSRHHIRLEKYAKDIDIEAKLMIEMVNTLYIPAAVEYLSQLGSIGEPGKDIAKPVAALVQQARKGSEELAKALKKADGIEDVEKKALSYCHDVKALFDPLRQAVDSLEGLVPAKLWPVPK